MCCCGKPTKNGEPGYSWDGKQFGIYQVDPPDVQEGDIVLFDEPGRCGGSDSHCHHVRLVQRDAELVLLMRNGGGDHCIQHVSYWPTFVAALSAMDSDSRYWILLAIAKASRTAEIESRQAESRRWGAAFIGKRIKKRKRGGSCTVWIDESQVEPCEVGL